MHEFQTFTYLDLQKTGSTFISKLLKEFSTEKEVWFRKHSPVGPRYDPGKFYFISVRAPLAQYLSLYSYGCGGNGGLFHRMRRAGFGYLYTSSLEGFREWLRFVLQPENGHYLERQYGRDKDTRELVGYQSYRYLKLAISNRRLLGTCKTQDDLRDIYRQHGIAKFAIRHEHFNADLEELVTKHLRDAIPNTEAALKFIGDGLRLRKSVRVDELEGGEPLTKQQLRKLQKREWLLHELFGY
jgi:hypothetical protein